MRARAPCACWSASYPRNLPRNGSCPHEVELVVAGPREAGAPGQLRDTVVGDLDCPPALRARARSTVHLHWRSARACEMQTRRLAVRGTTHPPLHRSRHPLRAGGQCAPCGAGAATSASRKRSPHSGRRRVPVPLPPVDVHASRAGAAAEPNTTRAMRPLPPVDVHRFAGEEGEGGGTPAAGLRTGGRDGATDHNSRDTYCSQL